MALNPTYAVRLGSIVAGIAWIVLVLAPGSRAEDSERPVVGAARAQIESDASSMSTPSTTVPAATTAMPATTAAPTPSVPATTAAKPGTPPTTAKPVAPGATAPRVVSLRDLVGVSIDRGATWIAIATATVVDQTGAPTAGVDVKATWSLENTAASCRTDTSGKCSMYRSGLPATLDAVTITMTAPLNGAKTIRREGVN
ncbi:MAG: hypothetical protein ABIQ73_18800 [Acidimicrobiales bacterium]